MKAVAHEEDLFLTGIYRLFPLHLRPAIDCLAIHCSEKCSMELHLSVLNTRFEMHGTKLLNGYTMHPKDDSSFSTASCLEDLRCSL